MITPQNAERLAIALANDSRFTADSKGEVIRIDFYENLNKMHIEKLKPFLHGQNPQIQVSMFDGEATSLTGMVYHPRRPQGELLDFFLENWDMMETYEELFEDRSKAVVRTNVVNIARGSCC